MRGRGVLMTEDGNFFTNELYCYYLEEEKKLSDQVITILNKSLADLTEKESEAYEKLILPSRQEIKRALSEKLGQPESSMLVWETNLHPYSQTIIGEIATEVLAETKPPATMGNSVPAKKTAPASREEIKPGDGKVKRTWRNSALKVLGWIATILLVIVVLFAAFMMLAPKFGLQTHAVLSGSMEPTLKVGGMIICRSTPVDRIKVGDIIGFSTQGNEEVTHRVIDILDNEGQIWLQTKGDANEDPDPDLISPTSDKVERVVLHVPYLGFFSSFMKTRLAFLMFICVPALILLILFSRDIWIAYREMRGKRKAKTAALGGSDLDKKP